MIKKTSTIILLATLVTTSAYARPPIPQCLKHEARFQLENNYDGIYPIKEAEFSAKHSIEVKWQFEDCQGDETVVHKCFQKGKQTVEEVILSYYYEPRLKEFPRQIRGADELPFLRAFYRYADNRLADFNRRGDILEHNALDVTIEDRRAELEHERKLIKDRIFEIYQAELDQLDCEKIKNSPGYGMPLY